MSKIMKMDLKAPASLQAVLEAVVRLGTHDESQILELAAAGRLQELFPFKPASVAPAADFVSEAALVEASPLPLDADRRARLMQSSLPSRPPRPRTTAKPRLAKRAKPAR